MHVPIEIHIDALISVGLFIGQKLITLVRMYGRFTTTLDDHERRINNLEAVEFVPAAHHLEEKTV